MGTIRVNALTRKYSHWGLRVNASCAIFFSMKRKGDIERPKLTGFRLFDLHRKLLKKAVENRKERVSEAQIVREAIEAYVK